MQAATNEARPRSVPAPALGPTAAASQTGANAKLSLPQECTPLPHPQYLPCLTRSTSR